MASRFTGDSGRYSRVPSSRGQPVAMPRWSTHAIASSKAVPGGTSTNPDAAGAAAVAGAGAGAAAAGPPRTGPAARTAAPARAVSNVRTSFRGCLLSSGGVCPTLSDAAPPRKVTGQA